MTRRVLIADDDPHIREVVRFALEKAGFEPLEAADGRQALASIRDDEPDLVVLDVMMPEMDGTDVCRRARAESDVPIIFLSSRDEEIDRVVGLELGGDDYVTKPFSPRELIARIKAIFRRLDALSSVSEVEEEGAAETLEHGKLRLDHDLFQASWADTVVTLTKTEFRLLATLMGYPGKVYSRSELMNGAYEDRTVVSDRTIDSHVRHVRQKFEELGGDPIETVHGMGYRLGDCE